jgi:glutamate-1-semialdehyde 2,1-aminomutase
MTPEAYAHMESLAGQLAAGLETVVERYRMPWHVVRVGARVEFICAPGPLRNGTEAEAAHAPALEQALHLALLNRGCLIAPFHNMMLVSPATTERQVASLVSAFESAVVSLAMEALPPGVLD